MRAPVVAVGYGALGFWAALRDVCPRHPRAAGLAMAFKLTESAQDRWPSVNGPELVALVREGVRFERGDLVEPIVEVAA